MDSKVKLAYGNGGEEGNEFISEIFFNAFNNSILEKQEDAAAIENESLVVSSNSFTVSPLFFNGGDIGKLAIVELVMMLL